MRSQAKGGSVDNPSVRIGVDTGGTFTDFLLTIDGEATVHKLPSTPDDPSRVISEFVATLPAPPTRVVHGSTVATNALLERKGARLVWITQNGFRDLIEIGRQDRPHLYDLTRHPDPPPVPRERRIELSGRLGPGGEEWEPLSSEELRDLPARVAALEPEAIAIGFLHSTENQAHEIAVEEALQSLGVPIVCSAALIAEPREFERFATALASAAVTPVMDRYLARLGAHLPEGSWSVMESSGGAMPWPRLRESAIRTVLSGPAGGVVAALRRAGAGAVAFDMGGTSTDVTPILSDEIPTTRNFRLGTWPIAVPVVDGETVGAGGGSIVWVDEGGALRVGPESAGADPGPICYGRGGTELTVTDANLYLGRLPSDRALGGSLTLARGGVDAAMEKLAAKIGLSPGETARGILRVVEAEMERALRRITQERGVDPRGLTLVSFGGAGGLHAVALAKALRFARVLIPAEPGILSASGMLEAPEIAFAEQTILERWTDDLPGRLATLHGALEGRCREDDPLEGEPDDRVEWKTELGVRVFGQSHELAIPWFPAAPQELPERFWRAYRTRFGGGDSAADRAFETDRGLEITALRVRRELSPEPAPRPRSPNVESAEGISYQPIVLDVGAPTPTSVRTIDRGALRRDEPIVGPARIDEQTSTLWLPSGARLSLRADGALEIDPGSEPTSQESD